MNASTRSIHLISFTFLLFAVLPFSGFHPNDADTISVSKAQYNTATSTLTVEATSSDPKAVLEVYETKKERLIGALNKDEQGGYAATFNIANPKTITIMSSQGGSAVVDVDVR